MLQHQTISPSARFSGVFQSKHNKLNWHDQIIAEADGNFLVPTLGSIVPNWLLALPRCYFLNYRAYAREMGKNPFQIVQATADIFGFDLSEIIWFEHGASSSESETGCGVDYAHLHILLAPVFSFNELHDTVIKNSTVKWGERFSSNVYNELNEKSDYYILGSGKSCIVHNSEGELGSQFFRRRIAEVICRPTEWDYRLHPFHENIVTTVKLTSAAKKVAA